MIAVDETVTKAKQTPKLAEDAQWAAVITRDPDFDGTFYFSVATTGVYCKPSCPSRQALRKNVRFYNTCSEAEAAGFRPCKRCKPNRDRGDVQALKIAQACQLIRASETMPDLKSLAAAAGLSAFHFHRVFKAQTGVTPKAYASAVRRARVQEALAIEPSVTSALFTAGFNSSQGFYASAPQILGMKPSDYKDGGKLQSITFAIGQCSLGVILVAESAMGVCAILLGDDAAILTKDLTERFPKAALTRGDRKFDDKLAVVVKFVEAPKLGLALPLDVRGTLFQHKVWQALQRVPAGQTVSYSDIAEKIGKPEAVRAVAGACAANPLAVAIPCHRVVRRDGGLSGYRWGIARKKALLEREKKG